MELHDEDIENQIDNYEKSKFNNIFSGQETNTDLSYPVYQTAHEQAGEPPNVYDDVVASEEEIDDDVVHQEVDDEEYNQTYADIPVKEVTEQNVSVVDLLDKKVSDDKQYQMKMKSDKRTEKFDMSQEYHNQDYMTKAVLLFFILLVIGLLLYLVSLVKECTAGSSRN